MRDVPGRMVSLSVTAFLIYAVLALGWSAGQMLVGIWLQTVVLWVLVALVALAIAARTHWGVFLVALPLVGFVFFVTGQFVNLFGMFAWGAWSGEHGVQVRMLSFNPFRNIAHFVPRVVEVMPLWQAAVLVGLQALFVVLTLRAPGAAQAGFERLFSAFNRRVFVNHFAVLLGGALAAALGGSRAILLALLGLLLAIDLALLLHAWREPPANAE